MTLSSIFKILTFLAAIKFHAKNELLVSFKDQSASFKCQNSQKILACARFLYKSEHFWSYKYKNITFKCLKNSKISCWRKIPWQKCQFQVSFKNKSCWSQISLQQLTFMKAKMPLSSVFKILKFLAGARFHDKSASFKCQNSKHFLPTQDFLAIMNIYEVLYAKVPG